MRFTLISFIGVLSLLQGCTKETPVPQLQSQATTDLDASPSSPTISSAPNSLRSSHQPKSAPNTSKSTKIEESVNEEQLTSGITDETVTVHVPPTQVNRGSTGTPISHNSDQQSSVIGVDNLYILPINRDVLPTREIGNNVEIIGERIDDNMSDSRSTNHVVTGSNQEEQPAGPQYEPDLERRVHLSRDNQTTAFNSNLRQSAVPTRDSSPPVSISPSQSSVDSNPGSSVEILNQNQEHQGVRTDQIVSVHVPTTEELRQQGAEIMRELERIAHFIPEEIQRDSLDTEIQFVRNTIDAADRFNADLVHLREPNYVSSIGSSALEIARYILTRFEQRLGVE